MKKQLLRLAVPVIIAICFLNLSCKKDIGFPPKYDLDKPYYWDLSFEDEWTIDLSIQAANGQYFYPQLKLANEDLLICYDHKEGVYAILMQTGEIAWKLEAENNSLFDPTRKLLVIDDVLVFYDHKDFMSIDLYTGQVLSVTQYSQIGDFRGSTISFTSNKDHLFLMTMQEHSNMGTQRLYKINPIAMDIDLLIEVETIVYDFSKEGHIFIDDENKRAYFLFAHRSDLTPIFMLADVNFDDKSFVIHELSDNTNLVLESVKQPFSVFQGVAFISSDQYRRLVAYNFELDTDLSIIPNATYVKSHGSKVFGLLPNLTLFDPENLDVEWQRSGFFPSKIGDFDLNEDSQILVAMIRTKLQLVDMSNGQQLIEKTMAKENTQNFKSNTVVSREKNLIFKAGYDQVNKFGFIRCIRSPIDL